jgi:hypothetical protein
MLNIFDIKITSHYTLFSVRLGEFMDMSFKEKSTWTPLISTLLIFGYYFTNMIALSGTPIEAAKIAVAGLLFQAIVFITIVEIVFQGMLVISNRKAAQFGADERDILFESKGNMLGYTV